MLAFLQYVVAYVIAREGSAGPGSTDVAGIVGVLAAFGFLSGIAGAWLRRRTAGDEPRALGRVLLAANGGRIASLAVFTVVAWTLGGNKLPRVVGVEGIPLLQDMVRLAPFFALSLSARSGLHPAMRQIGLGPPALREAWASELKQSLLPLLPLVILFASFDLLTLAARTSPAGRLIVSVLSSDVLQVGFALGVVFAGLLAMPFVLRLFWRATPLPAGPLRDRLEAYSRRIGFRARDILVWPAEGHLNAAVIGAFPRFRYVVLTRALLETLDTDEIAAVFAHEAGHARRGHILLFFGFTAVLPLAMLAPGPLGGMAVTFLTSLPVLARVGLIVLVWLGVVFGFVSRRFEQEADVFGIETLGERGDLPPTPENHPFARALERIAVEAGGIREVTGWRHFSIADRVEFVRDYLTDAAVRRRFRRNIFLLRGGMILGILAFALPAAARVPGEIDRAVRTWQLGPPPAEALLLQPLNLALQAQDPVARARNLVQAGLLAGESGRGDAELRWFREAVALAPRDPVALTAFARALERSGRPRGALLAWEDLLAIDEIPADLRATAQSRATALAIRLGDR